METTELVQKVVHTQRKPRYCTPSKFMTMLYHGKITWHKNDRIGRRHKGSFMKYFVSQMVPNLLGFMRFCLG